MPDLYLCLSCETLSEPSVSKYPTGDECETTYITDYAKEMVCPHCRNSETITDCYLEYGN